MADRVLGSEIMKRTHQCPKCNSKEIVRAHALDRGMHNSQHTLSLATYARPDAWFFKGQTTVPLSAYVCTDCGFVEIYAVNPADLKD
jgi:predicted RNA-binding Zn-ribbon protein involved in translation (DUF1610 family)